MTKLFRFRLWVWMAIVGAAIITAVTAFYFRSQSVPLAISNSVLVAQAALSIAAIPFVMHARHNFRKQFHSVYILLGLGIGLLGIAQLQSVILSITKSWFWIDSGLVGILFLASTILIFLAMRQFNLALHLRNRWTSLWWAGILAAVIAVFAGMLALVLPGVLSHTFNITIAFSAWNATLAFLAVILSGHVARTVSGIYETALGRLNVALVCLAFSSAQYIIVGMYMPLSSWPFRYGVLTIMFAITGALFLRAGVSFNFIGEARPGLYRMGPATSLNIITYTASLASDQEAIDEILDGVRKVSATLAPGEVPDQQLQHELAAIYLELEEYLVSKEVMQDFSVKALRERIEATLGLRADDPETFWPIITGQAFTGHDTTD